MRFELTVALKYLIPKWRQLSVSIISLISVLVISLVVWLVLLFLSVSDGIEKKWISELVALNAPLRLSPTEAYYQSYYHLIDSVSGESNYSPKSISEKMLSPVTDPYDARNDRELSLDFPPPDRYEDGTLKDLVKEAYGAIQTLPYDGIRSQEYEVSFGNLRLSLVRETSSGERAQTFLTQISYIASHDGENSKISQMKIPFREEDYNNLLKTLALNTASDSGEEGEPSLSQESSGTLGEQLKVFFDHLEVTQLQTAKEGFVLLPSLFPKQGSLKGVALIRQGQISKIIIPKSVEELVALDERLKAFGFKTVSSVHLLFDEEQMHLSTEEAYPLAQDVQIVLDEQVRFEAQLIPSTVASAESLSDLQFKIQGTLQGVAIDGKANFEKLEIAKALQKENDGSSEPFWIYSASKESSCRIPKKQPVAPLGEGLLVAKQFQKNGVCLGDRGFLSYYSLAGSSMQEQLIPVYIAGFYDPGMLPLGSKLVFVDPQITAMLRSNTTVTDSVLGNGINVWLERVKEAPQVKKELIKSLEARGISKYWSVQSYQDYEFTRPILEQLQSDKTIFSLVSVIILMVACSNIISMLILLVNDKKKEIGILQSMGASPGRIALIFGLCGFITGMASCVIGVTAAIFTLKNLHSLVAFLSFLQGHEAFQAAFYGNSLPNQLSYPVLILVLVATLFISLLAGIIPAIKASRVRPAEILRSE